MIPVPTKAKGVRSNDEHLLTLKEYIKMDAIVERQQMMETKSKKNRQSNKKDLNQARTKQQQTSIIQYQLTIKTENKGKKYNKIQKSKAVEKEGFRLGLENFSNIRVQQSIVIVMINEPRGPESELKTLYERKYFDSAVFPEPDSFALRISERLKNFNRKRIDQPVQSRSFCLQLPKPDLPKPQHIRIRNLSTANETKQTSNRGVGSCNSGLSRECELVRQVMRLTRNEMSEFQVSMGGENNLMRLFGDFYQKRHQINEEKRRQRQQHSNDNFRPHKKKSQDEETPHPTTSRQIRQRMVRGSPVQKKQNNLTPWLVNEADFA